MKLFRLKSFHSGVLGFGCFNSPSHDESEDTRCWSKLDESFAANRALAGALVRNDNRFGGDKAVKAVNFESEVIQPF